MGVLSWFGRRRTTPRPLPEPPLREEGGAAKVAYSAASSSPAGPSAIAGLSPRAAADRCETPFLEAPVKNDSTLTPGSSLPYLPEGDEDAGPFDSPSDDDDDDDDAATAASTAGGGVGLRVAPPYDKAAFCVVTAASEVATRYVELFGTELHVSVSPCEKVQTHLDLHDPSLALVRIAGGIDVRLRPQPTPSPSATASSAEASATLVCGAEPEPSPLPAAAKPTILRRLLSRFFTPQPPPPPPPPPSQPAAAAAGGPPAGSGAHRGASPAPAEAAATELLLAGMPRSRSCTGRRPCDAAAGSEMTEWCGGGGGGGGGGGDDGDAPATRGHASSAPPTSASFASAGPPPPPPPPPPAAEAQPPSPRHSVIRFCFLGDGAEEAEAAAAGAGTAERRRPREEEWADAIRRALACAASGREGAGTLPGTFFEGEWPASEEAAALAVVPACAEEEEEDAEVAAAASSPSLTRVHSKVSSNRGSCAKTASDESVASSSSFVTFFSSLFGRKKDRKKGAAAAAAAAAATSAASAASAATQDGAVAPLRRTATEDQVAAGPPPPLVGDGRRLPRPATPLPPPSPRSGGSGSVSTASEQQPTPVLGFLSPFSKSKSRRRSAAAGLPPPPPPPPPTPLPPPTWAEFFAATLPQANGQPASDADFQKVRTLGGGSYSAVWKVEHTGGEAGGGDSSKERAAYALKVIRKDLARREEVTALAYLQHPFVVRLHTAFETEHDINLLLDYLPGGELFRLVGRHWPSVGCDVIEGSTRFYGAQVSLALAYIHQQGFVYRDLKPENVVLDRGGHAVLVDFGLCKRLTATDPAASPVSLRQPPAATSADTGRKDSFCGTPEYLAPEVLTGHSAVTQAVDFWSLGCLLYFLSTGAPPFTGPHPTHVYTSILEGDVAFPQGSACLPLRGGGDSAAANPAVQPQTRPPPPETRDVILRLLAKTPDARLRSFADLQAHAFFHDFDWAGAEERRTVPPLRAMLRGESDAGGAAAAMAGSCGGSVKTDGIGVLSSPNNSFFNDFSGKYLHSSPPAALAAEGGVVLMDG